MAARANSVDQLECLVRQALAERQALADREPRREGGVLPTLLAIDPLPLLPLPPEHRIATVGSHAHSLRARYDSAAALSPRLNGALSDAEPVGFAWLALLTFVRIATRRAIFPNPLAPAAALDLVDAWLDRPQAAVLAPGDGHARILRELVEAAGSAGDLTSAAHLAAIAIEHGARLATFDTDFHRFRGLRVDYLG